MSQIRVALGKRSYPIIIDAGSLQKLPALCKKYFTGKKLAILTNKTLYPLFHKKIDSLLKKKFSLHWIVIPDGEAHKNLHTVEKIYHQLLRAKIDRTDSLIALGGGVVGDIAGYAAATYLRGIAFAQIPTTLLSQVDSSVGGKTGVDLPEGKNLVGAFYQPKWVLIDTHFLKTLPLRQLRSGLVEVIKYGIIKDPTLFLFIEKNIQKILQLNQECLKKIIRRSCEIKAAVVAQDEREGNLRATLNFGHTLGHAIETLTNYKSIQHGEAVGQGMVFAAHFSAKKGFCKPGLERRIASLLKRVGLSTQWPVYTPARYRRAFSRDKKATGNLLKFVVLKKLGRVELKLFNPPEIINQL